MPHGATLQLKIPFCRSSHGVLGGNSNTERGKNFIRTLLLLSHPGVYWAAVQDVNESQRIPYYLSQQ